MLANTEQDDGSLREQLPHLVGEYKASYGVLKDLKAEIEHLQHLLEQGRLRMTRDFEAWYIEVYQANERPYAPQSDLLASPLLAREPKLAWSPKETLRSSLSTSIPHKPDDAAPARTLERSASRSSSRSETHSRPLYSRPASRQERGLIPESARPQLLQNDSEATITSGKSATADSEPRRDSLPLLFELGNHSDEDIYGIRAGSY